MQRLASWFLAKLAALAPGTAGNAADPYDLWSDLLEIALWSNK
jgi:hypothetical protein